MKSVWWRGSAALLVVLLASSLGAPALAGDTLPIHGRFVGTVELTRLSDTPPVFRVGYLAVGRAAHLGLAQATLSTPEVELDLFGRRLIVRTPQWSGTIVAANGDEVSGAYAFRDSIVRFSLLGEFSLVADLEVLEGTGRFSGATGEAVAIISGNVFTGTFGIDIEGSISTVGSSNR